MSVFLSLLNSNSKKYWEKQDNLISITEMTITSPIYQFEAFMYQVFVRRENRLFICMDNPSN
jgi:hypothetical protein